MRTTIQPGRAALARRRGSRVRPNNDPQLTDHDLICFSHLRWDSVFQRPQHLMTRCALKQRVYFFEEPLWDADEPWLELQRKEAGPCVAVPHLPSGAGETEATALQHRLLNELLESEEITSFVAWYYTPMALPFSRHLKPAAVVYDCMDELSNFRFAPAQLRGLEAELFRRTDVVFTGGQSLYEAKRAKHGNIHPFPSSIEPGHFGAARRALPDPRDQADLPEPRLGFFGVIDERLDTALLAGIADARPAWQLVMIGPVVKIDPADLPRRPNIRYLGRKEYSELPRYLANWQVALLPFACNDATRYISPTKTLEYLAAAKPVVSTPIRDVVRPYGESGMVAIADGVEGFVAATEEALAAQDRTEWLEQVDAYLARTCWDETWSRMMAHVTAVIVPVSQAHVRGD